VAQNSYGNCLNKGEGVGIDFEGAAHYFKLAANQGIERENHQSDGFAWRAT
jgi:TPR repeat protein